MNANIKNSVKTLSEGDLKRLWDLLALHNTNRIDYNTRKWETLKFFQTVCAALIAATVAALIAVSDKSHFSTQLALVLATLPFAAAASAIIAIVRLKQESRLLFIEELQIFKLAKLLGLDFEVHESERWLSKDTYLLPDKWRDSNYRTKGKNPLTATDWINARVHGHGFLDAFEVFFALQVFLCLGLMEFICHRIS